MSDIAHLLLACAQIADSRIEYASVQGAKLRDWRVSVDLILFFVFGVTAVVSRTRHCCHFVLVPALVLSLACSLLARIAVHKAIRGHCAMMLTWVLGQRRKLSKSSFS